MSSLVTKWVVLRSYDVGADDLDADSIVRDDAVERWIDEARDAYLECCPVLRQLGARSGLLLRARMPEVPSGRLLGSPTTVMVSAGATEYWPTSFAIGFRLRTRGSTDDVAVNATCVVSVEDAASGDACELGDAVRDELIALAHAARYYN